MAMRASAVVMLVLLSASCSPVRYHTIYDSTVDPLFDLKQAKTVGLMPAYWTTLGKTHRVDRLMERQLLAYCKAELEKRGYVVTYIMPEFLYESGDTIAMVSGLQSYPDLTLTLGFRQEAGTFTVPGKSEAWSSGLYGGVASSSESYDVAVYTLAISLTIWVGAPTYTEPVWRGTVLKGRPHPDLSKQAESMVAELFRKEFPR